MSSAFENHPLRAFVFHFCVRSDKDMCWKIQHLDLRRTLLSLHQNSLGCEGFSMLWREKDVPLRFRRKVRAFQHQSNALVQSAFKFKGGGKVEFSLSSSTQVSKVHVLLTYNTVVSQWSHTSRGGDINLCTVLTLLFDFVTSSSAHR